MALRDLSPGTVFAGDFTIVGPLGQGGMGSVYTATQTSTGHRRALKLMHPSLVADAKLRERFEQEARVGAQIASDHVVQVIAAGVDAASGLPWLAMELLDGETLAALVARRGALPPGEVREIMSQLGHALGAAHAAGIVHRDLKPENVFLARSRRADEAFTLKVLDFGIAKVVALAKTTATAAIGTPLWMSPEQTRTRARIGPQTDVWPLGLMAFWMLTGQHYWLEASEEASVEALMREVLFDPMAPASERAAELDATAPPPGFDAWFAKAVAREPESRFAGAAEAVEELDAILAAPPAIARTIPDAPLGFEEAKAPKRKKKKKPKSPPPVVATEIVARTDGNSGSVTGPSAAQKPADAAKRKRLFAIGGGTVVTAVIIGLVVHAVSTPGIKIGAAPLGGSEEDTKAAVPIDPPDPIDGDENALVTLMELNDLVLPAGRTLHEHVTAVKRRHDDKVRIVWKHHVMDPDFESGKAAVAAQAIYLAGGRDAFWKAVEHLYAGEPDVSTDDYARLAVRSGVSADAFAERMNEAKADAFATMGETMKLGGFPPRLLIDGEAVDAASSEDKIDEVVNEHMKRAETLLSGDTSHAELYSKMVTTYFKPPDAGDPGH